MHSDELLVTELQIGGRIHYIYMGDYNPSRRLVTGLCYGFRVAALVSLGLLQLYYRIMEFTDTSPERLGAPSRSHVSKSTYFLRYENLVEDYVSA
jgi:hypothetical protein